MILLWVRPTPWCSRCACAVAGNPLPRTTPARSQDPTKISASRSTILSVIARRWQAARQSPPALALYRGRLLRRFAPRNDDGSAGLNAYFLARQVAQVHPEAARLAAPQCGVGAAAREELGVGAFLDDPAVVEHDQPVHAADCRQPVGDRDDCAPFHQFVELFLDRRLDLAV